MDLLSELVTNTFILSYYCLIVSATYPILNYVCSCFKLYNELSYSKQSYVVKNISKSSFEQVVF